MKNFDHFDESIKRKMDGMNFQFNEANWEKMSRTLDASRPSKKPIGKLPIISSIVIGSALIIGSVWFFTSSSSNSNVVADNNSAKLENTQAVVVEANSTLIPNNKSTGSSNALNLSSDENTNSNSSASSFVESASQTNNSNSSSNVNTNYTSNKAEKKITANKHSDKKDLAVGSMMNSDNDKAVIDLSTPINNEGENNNQSLIGKEEGARLKNGGSTDVKTDITDNTDVLVTSMQGAEKTLGTEEQNIITNNKENDIVALPSLTTTLGRTADEIAAANLKTSVTEEKKAWEYVRVKHHTFSFEGGAINSFGWKVNQTRNGNNISPVLGINYMYNFDSRSSLLIGLQYNSIANLGEAKANFSVTTYGFGINNDVTTYKLMDLHYAVMPVKYIHRIDKNNALGFGLNMMYLINTRTQITRSTIVESNLSNETEKYYEMGYGFDQLNTFNSQIAVSYHHNISTRLALNAEINKSVINVVKDYKYFGAKNANSAPASIKLSLTYTLFNK